MLVPKVCPLCSGKLKYTSGDGMADNTAYCPGKKSHSNYGFSCEASGGDRPSQWFQIYLRNSETSIRWTFEKYGDIPAETLTVGKDYSPYQNKRITWFEPDFTNINTLLEKFKWYIIFN